MPLSVWLPCPAKPAGHQPFASSQIFLPTTPSPSSSPAIPVTMGDSRDTGSDTNAYSGLHLLKITFVHAYFNRNQLGSKNTQRGHRRGPLSSPSISSTQANLFFKAAISQPNCIIPSAPSYIFRESVLTSAISPLTVFALCSLKQAKRQQRHLFCRHVSTWKKPGISG